MDECELGYAAGIIDGEGYIGIAKGKDERCRSGYCYVLRVLVQTTDIVICPWLFKNFGGNLYSRDSQYPGQKDSFVWQITNSRTISFLELILPYLKLKNKQAELAISFQARRQRRHPGSFVDYEKDEQDFLRMKELKGEKCLQNRK